MSGATTRPALKLVHAAEAASLEHGVWFCGHCAAPAPGNEPPAPIARVCRSCGMGLMLESRADAVPGPDDAFLVVDSSLRIQALSKRTESMLAVSEAAAVNEPLSTLVVPADAEAQGAAGFAGLVHEAFGGGEPLHCFVRPWNTFGVRMRARVSLCGPPRAALIVLDVPAPALRCV